MLERATRHLRRRTRENETRENDNIENYQRDLGRIVAQLLQGKIDQDENAQGLRDPDTHTSTFENPQKN